MSGEVIHVNFPNHRHATEDIARESYQIPEGANREQRMEFVARATANIFMSATAGDVEDMEELTMFVEDCFSGFSPPLTPQEHLAVERRAKREVDEIFKQRVESKGA